MEDERKYPCEHFFNRELSWVEFNARVLNEGLRKDAMPLDRLKFLSIVSANFDEFFMVRVATLKRQVGRGNGVSCPSGLSPQEQLDAIRRRVLELHSLQYSCLREEIFPALDEGGLVRLRPGQYSMEQHSFVNNYFESEVFPTLTPVRADDGEIPVSRNLSLMLAFLLRRRRSGDGEQSAEIFSRGDMVEGDGPFMVILEIPPSMDRILYLPGEDNSSPFTLLDDVILANAGMLFPGFTIIDSIQYRITRDADLSVDEERDEDFLEAMELVLIDRQQSSPVRLEVRAGSETLKARLIQVYGISTDDVYEFQGPLDLKALMPLSGISGFEALRERSWKGVWNVDLPGDGPLWEEIRKHDLLLHHPYEVFDPVIRLLNDGADDPNVLAIKMTLYRTSGSSPIISALARAAENGKQVTALVELKARFDEEQNIEWAQRLERAGVIVIFGIARLKVHAKACLIIRKEAGGIKKYLHMGTGNYNEKTARIYTDFSLLTTDENLTYEATLFFNAITGYSTIPELTNLYMAPISLKDKLISLIRREVERTTDAQAGRIMAKMNSLADPDVIEALYAASNAGVTIDLNVRGICMLKPGVEALSENIRVVSIIDRYLEHSRIFCFYNGGETEVFLSSADWMPRNLERRVELMFPVPQPDLKERLVRALEVFFSDASHSYVLLNEGRYTTPSDTDGGTRAQNLFRSLAEERSNDPDGDDIKEFVVRRNPPASR